MLSDKFQMMAASVMGQRHLAEGTNNQDAFWVGQNEHALVGLVSDGCSGSPQAEVGAALHVQMLGPVLLARAVEWAHFATELDPDLFLNGSLDAEWMPSPRKFLQDQLEALVGLFAASLEMPREKVVDQFFYATIMGVVVTESKTFIFRRGDGVWQINGGPPVVIDENDIPSYFAHGLNPYTNSGNTPKQFTVEKVLPTSEVDRLIIGSDGMERFVSKPNHSAHAGKPLGSLDQFYDPVYLQDPGNGQIRLLACGPYLGWRRGSSALDDDTTFIRLQRYPAPVGN